MSQKIITLPKQLANQIAAGEVVERPISVVKELVENSIDAWASKVEVHLKNGWIDEILVKDDGLWIPWEELLKSLEKYSTSKIRSLDDLYKVMTFWFRWEALASISSVSEFSISSKTWSDSHAKNVTTQGWEDFKESVVAHEVWTSVKVSRLFFNTPARLSYLKTPRTEYLKTQDFLYKISLAYPEVSFTLFHEGKQVFHFPKNQEIAQRVYNVYGAEFSENMIYISHRFSWVTVSGYITDPKISFKNRNRQVLFINKRVIQSAMIAKAVADWYNRFIPHGSYPWYILSIDIDPTQVDVNVHPRKMEVRFAQESSIFRSVFHGVKNELERVSLAKDSHSLEKTGERFHADNFSTTNTREYYTGSGTKFKNYSPYKNTQSNPSQESIEFSKKVLWVQQANQQFKKNQSEVQDLRDTPMGKIIGQVHNSYIVVETHDGIKILDQHALAERVLYEKLARDSYVPKTQWLLTWVGLHLSWDESVSLDEYHSDFEAMWFEIEILSWGNILINGVPDFMQHQDIAKIFMQILTDMSSAWSRSFDEIRHKIWAYTACRSAVKFWDTLSVFEMQKLLHDATLDYSATCPHGRPVVYDISLSELLDKYER